jgi:hypothetical protein
LAVTVGKEAGHEMWNGDELWALRVGVLTQLYRMGAIGVTSAVDSIWLKTQVGESIELEAYEAVVSSLEDESLVQRRAKTDLYLTGRGFRDARTEVERKRTDR